MESITRPRNTTHPTHNKLKDPITTEPSTSSNKPRKVAVVYYLSRIGNLEHPHLIQVPLSSPDGLYLRDVINRLNSLRGKGMAASYSWSSKRSYKNGFVWHDLSDNDFIYPAHGQDYVLKGSEKSSSPDSAQVDFPAVKHRRNQSCSATEYNVYTGLCSAGTAVATQTDEKRRRRRAVINEEVENESSELSREEMSPPPSDDSSPETLESVMKADGLIILTENRKLKTDPTVGNKGKANVLMQLITCGSISARDGGPGGNPGFSLIKHYKSRLVPRGGGVRDENAVVLSKKQVVTEDKEYFSGSLVETKKEKFAAIKRSNSYTGNR
ncbi:hypothetical protein HanRHA438_Chr04g0171641 [Helianthus annuus]|uniref:SOSEKI DIX-like domain-containing protein n=1 Tax=Helianthus annuus TaxID=4232 RepID=A0A251UXJ1_HELAN|nr:protein UPSTREAM OF FLC [Helianthus annuus]KAF5809783.1 hypothetical protein HanXRQr2_Chr04g0161471 [Helianthus annuus]KAJ0580751.1 putative protein SOSEKI [Helianthus annuus]KAJ0588425.1 hypothetical protein HanIR_Chr04g0174521 [Helianthus annuus]KAJ0596699.1 putative protein SOSEKI [Helianthus annuus]KAJ0757371.1 putative protein SOSEKI [Helianthus annuus]